MTRRFADFDHPRPHYTVGDYVVVAVASLVGVVAFIVILGLFLLTHH